jgi:hypothetical protein
VHVLALLFWSAARAPCLPVETDALRAEEPSKAAEADSTPPTPPAASVPDPGAAIFSGAAPTVPATRPASSAAPAAPPAVSAGRPPFLPETAAYRVSYGILGEVATATVTFAPVGVPLGTDSSPVVVRAVGTGEGSVLGFGKTAKRIESEFDVRALKTTRWTSIRSSGGEMVTDIAEQQKPGTVSLVRKRSGHPDQADTITRASALLDPLGLLLRIRLGPLKEPASFEILDGRALWVVTISAARPTDETPPMLQVDGRTEPIFWDGSPDKERTGRAFTLFLSNDSYRTPLRLIVPFGLGHARAEIIQLSRAGTARHQEIRFMPLIPSLCRLVVPTSGVAPACPAMIDDGSGFPVLNLVIANPGT